MISSITNFLFGATGEEYATSSIDYNAGLNLKTTPTEDEWMLVDRCVTEKDDIESNPMENLLIEHPSMSVYEKSKIVEKKKQGLPASARVAGTSRSAASKLCLTNRTEPYNLRKSTMQKAKLSRTQTSAKALQKHNKAYNLKSKHVTCRPVVFQPRK